MGIHYIILHKDEAKLSLNHAIHSWGRKHIFFQRKIFARETMKKSKNVLYHRRLSQNIVLLIGISLFEEKQTKPIDIIFFMKS